jgi:hypothetical protein
MRHWGTRWFLALLLVGASCANREPAPRTLGPAPVTIAAPEAARATTASAALGSAPTLAASASSAPAGAVGSAQPAPRPSAPQGSSRMCAKSGGPDPAAAQPSPGTSRPVAPGMIRCGSARCDAKTQVCCKNPTTAPRCAARLPLSPEARAGRHGSQAELLPAYFEQMNACVNSLGTPGVFDNVAVWYCDDSGDCPTQQVCSLTQDTLNSASLTILECKPATLVTKALAYEQCTDDGPCRLPDTICSGNNCVLRRVGRDCGDESCPTGTACCWRRSRCFECTKAGECQDGGKGVAQDCFASRDCPAPRRCRVVLDADSVGVYYYGGSSCQVGDYELCRTDADCRPAQGGHRLKACAGPRGMPVPWPDDAPRGLKLCDYSD